MIEEFEPQTQLSLNERPKNLAYITSEGSPDYDFGVCYLMDKGEEAILYSPGDSSYNVKHNVGKTITFTGLHPARKGNRKWVANAAPLTLLPEDLRNKIITPIDKLKKNVEQKSCLNELNKVIDDVNEEDNLTLAPKKIRLNVTEDQYKYLIRAAAANGHRGRYAIKNTINEMIDHCKKTGFI